MGAITQSTTPLAANASWISGPFNLRQGGEGTASGEGATINVSGTADQAGVCRIEESHDGVTYRVNALVAAEPGKYFSFQAGLSRSYWQVVFQNGATAQATFTISVDATDSPLLSILQELRKLNMSVLSLHDRRPASRESRESLLRM